MASANKLKEQDNQLSENYRIAAFWKAKTDEYAQAMRKWHKRGNTVVKRFRDERNRVEEGADRRMNYLWANTQVMFPAIYSTCPIPIVDRKFLDRDPTGRLSSQMLERSIKNELDQNGFHNAVGSAVLDKLLPGRGVVWCRYVPEFGEGESLPGYNPNGIEDSLNDAKNNEPQGSGRVSSPETKEDEKLEETGEILLAEATEVDYIDWRDFGYAPVKARTWSEVQAIWKRVYISRKEAKDFFGPEIGRKLKPDTTPRGTGQNPELDYSETSVFQDINERNIQVWEIWNKSDRKVYWISSGYEYLCKVEDDPLELVGFFPVPPPLFSTSTNDTLVPVPDYIEWQDQAIQIDELTQRLAMLAKACKVVGVYSSKETAVKRIFDEGCENEMLPVDQWAMFAESGGLKGVIDFVPLDQIQKCIETLQKVRQQVQIDLDQVTGLSDVIRGTTDSRETLGGLRLKNNNAGTRLSKSQTEVARFARDTIKIIAEIICKHFSDDSIIQSSGILFEDALQPDTVLREWESENVVQQQSQPNAPQGQEAKPQSPNSLPSVPLLPPPGAAPQGSPMPGMLANPMAGSPQATPQQNNVIPFPGAGPNQPVLPQMQLPNLPPAMPDPDLLIADKLNKAISLLRQDIKRNYRIDIETDSTIFGDKYQERQDATEFIAALGAFMKQFGESAAAEPDLMPLMGSALQWGIRKWRVGRDLESQVDTFVANMTKKAKLLKDNPKPSPEEQKAQADIQVKMQEAKIQEQNDARDHARMERDDQRQFQMDQAKDQRELQKMQMEMQLERERMDMERQKMQMEMQIMQAKHQMEMQKMHMDAQVKTHEANVNQQTKEIELQHDAQSHQNEMQMEHERMGMEREKMTMEGEQADKEHQMKMQQNEQAHKQKMQQSQEAGKIKNQNLKKKSNATKKKAS